MIYFCSYVLKIYLGSYMCSYLIDWGMFYCFGKVSWSNNLLLIVN